jgi:hypothetical protein
LKSKSVVHRDGRIYLSDVRLEVGARDAPRDEGGQEHEGDAHEQESDQDGLRGVRKEEGGRRKEEGGRRKEDRA